MKRKQISKLLMGIVCITLLGATACGTQATEATENTAAESNTESATDSGSDASGEDEEVTVSQLSVTEDMAGFKEDDSYTDWTIESYNAITLNGDTITMDGSGATTDGTVLTIHEPGTYVLSGTLDEGSIVVNATDSADVRIVLNGVTLHSETTAPIQVLSADKVTISLMEKTENTVTDGNSYEDEELTAAIYSKADLVFNGTGTLNLVANVNNGIQSKDDLRILEGTYVIDAADDGLVGKDKVSIQNGIFTINSGGDGIKSTNDTDTDAGFVYIANGEFDITSGTDGIQAETGMLLVDGTYNITADGGYENAAAHPGMGGASMGDMKGGRGGWTPEEDTDTTEATEEATDGSKGLKAGGTLILKGGTYTINASNDTIHSNYEVTIEDGIYNLQSGDDGIHADEILVINNGTINIDTCYEGIESADITVNGGTIDLTATDDGINAAGGNIDATSQSGQPGGMMRTSSGTLTINGGTINVDAAGDGLDSNGNITQTGGDITILGPTDSGNGALDYDGTYVVTGGTLLAIGSSGMLQTTDSSSTVNCLTLIYTSNQAAGTTITVKDADGNVVMTSTPDKDYSCFVWASANITDGETYTIYAGDTKLTDVTISQVVTQISDTGEATDSGPDRAIGGRMQGGGERNKMQDQTRTEPTA